MTTANQDSVLLPPGGKPALIANDLWEHAYYLREWWRVVNWTYADERLRAIRSGEMDRLGGLAR